MANYSQSTNTKAANVGIDYNPQRDFFWLIIQPWLWIPRTFYIISSLTLFLLKFLAFSSSSNSDTQRNLAKSLRMTIANLGPCFIKVGQALSTRPDLVKQEWLDELTKLQDSLPAFKHQIALKIIEKELGKPANIIFEYFPEHPIASASLGQVYKAKTKDDCWVAVKVQRPNLVFAIRRDLTIVKFLGQLTAPFLPLNLGFGLGDIIDEFGINLFKEIDYNQEADNAEKFANQFKNNRYIKVPDVKRILSTKKVLTTSWIEGTKLKNREVLIKNNIEPTSIIRTAVTSGIQQLLEFGYFHADPHPGNLFALNAISDDFGSLGYVDFGMMDSITDSDRITLTGAIVHLINNDYYLLAKDFQKLGFLSKTENIESIENVLKNVLGSVITKNVNDFNIKTITNKFSELMFDYPFRVPARFALIIRAVVSQEGLALKLDPQFKILRFAYPYIAKRLLTEQNEEMIALLMDIIFDSANNIRVERIESLLNVLEDDVTSNSNDLLSVARDSVKLLFSKKGYSIRQKILLSIIKNDKVEITEIKALIKLIQKKYNPNSIVKDIFEQFIPKLA